MSFAEVYLPYRGRRGRQGGESFGLKDEGLEAVAEVMEDVLKIIESCEVSVPLFYNLSI